MTVDVQIIGGGLIGLSTAFALQKKGASIRVIERCDGVGLETSFANAGMLHASIAAPWNHPGVGWELLKSFIDPHSAMKLRLSQLPSVALWGLKFLAASRERPHWHATEQNFKLASQSMAINDQWRNDLAMDIDYYGNGLLNIMRTQAQFEQAKTTTGKLQSLGFEAEFLNPNEMIAKEPALSTIADNIVGAIYYPTDYSADAYKFCKALATHIKKSGGEIYTDTPVDSFLQHGNKITGVVSADKEFLADTTIVAAGAFTTKLVNQLGINLPMRPVKGYSLTFDGLSEAGNKAPMMPVVDEGLHAAMTPLGDRLRIAGTAEITGFNTRLPKSRLEPLLGMLQSVYPDFAQGLSVEDGQPWCGFRPISADGIPFIGHTSVQGLAINTGHGHMGWTLAAGSGELLANLLLGRKTKLNARVFNPMR